MSLESRGHFLGPAEIERALRVVDDEDTLTGVVTLEDVVATVGEGLAGVATVIESQSLEYSP